MKQLRLQSVALLIFTLLSTGLFAQPMIYMTSPNGGESWAVGSSHNITWGSMSVTNVNIFYSTDNGVNWVSVAQNIPAVPSSYSWTVPNAVSTQVKVKVADTGGYPYGQSSNFFSITDPPSSITLVSPNGGESWVTGSTHNITWTSQSVAYLMIEYKLDNGSWIMETDGTDATLGSYAWTVPTTASGTYVVRLTMAGNQAVYDTSNAYFTVTTTALSSSKDILTFSLPQQTGPATINTMNHTVAIQVQPGTQTNALAPVITVSAAATINPASGVAKDFKYPVIYTVTAEDGSTQQWTATVTVLVPVTVDSPNGGELWIAGSTHNITWSSTGVMSVNIQYLINNVYTTIATNVPAFPPSYSWTIPSDLNGGNNYRIVVRSVQDTSYSDQSNAYFSITQPPSITLTSPSGDESWEVGSSHNITWTSVAVQNIFIEYSTDGGTNWSFLNGGNSMAASLGTYAWTIPNTLSYECQVKVSDRSNGALFALNNAYFSIVEAQPTISNVISLNGSTDYIEVPDNSAWDLAGDFSISLWVKLNSTANSPMFIAHEENGGAGGFEFYYDGTQIMFNASNIYTGVLQIPYQLQTGTWYNLVVTRSGTMVNLFVNGSNQGDGYLQGSIANTTGLLRIGGYCCPAAGFVNGQMDDVSFWDRELTFNEVASLYSNPVLAGTEQGLVAYWDMNITGAGAGVSVPNRTGAKTNGINGTTIGTAFSPTFVPHSATMGTLVLNTPNGTENWTVATSHNITWTASAVDSVKIEYSTNNGTSWTYVAKVLGSLGTYAWTIPNTPSDLCKVKIYDYLNATIADTSVAVFTIAAPVGSITIESPNGGETWAANSTHDIIWFSSDVSLLNIYLSTNNGVSWDFINDGIDATLGSFSWFVSDVNSTQCLIKVEDLSNPAVYAVSSSMFTITGTPVSTLAVTSPNGGENWVKGSSHNITWTSSNVPDVKIKLWNATTTTTIASNVQASLGSYTWSIPGNTPVGSGYKINVMSMDSTITDYSDATFTLSAPPTAWVSVMEPAGGTVLTPGNTTNISWYTSAAMLNLFYSTNNGTNWVSIANGISGTTSPYVWTVPIANSTQCLIKIEDAANSSAYGISFNPFTITTGPVASITVNAPNGGESWAAGSTQNITWSSLNTSTVKIKLWYNAAYTTIASNIQASLGSYSWAIPSGTTPDTKYMIYVMSSDSAVSDISDAYFEITAPASTITLTSPMGGENWSAGTSYNITWTSSGVTNVNLEYSTNNGTNWNTINASVSAVLGSYAWSVPYTPSTQCKVRVSDVLNTSLYSQNAFNFTISSSMPDVLSITPSTATQGQTLTFNIQSQGMHYGGNDTCWFRQGPYNIAPTEVIAENSNLLFATTTIPAAAPTGMYDIIVYNTTDGTYMKTNVLNISAATSSLALTSPNGGESWEAGSTHSITWTSTGISTVKIKLWHAGLQTIAANIQASLGSYSWTIPANTIPGTNYSINIMAIDSSIEDYSNGNFTITAPVIDNYSLQFASNKYISITDAPAFNIGTTFTIESWIKTSANAQQGIISQGMTGNGYSFFILGGNLYYQYYSGGSYNNSTTALGVLASLNDNNWHHIAIVKNGANGKLYIDGMMVQQITNMNPVDESTSNIQLGYHPNVGSFTGFMDEVRFWNTARTATEIQTYKNVCLTSPQTGLVAAYNFNNGTNSSTLTDYSGNGNNGTLTNMNAATDWVASGVTCSPLASSISVISPNGTESWVAGSTQNITWTSSNVSSVKIKLWRNAIMTTIANNVQASLGTYSWTIPTGTAAGTDYMVYIMSTDSTVSDYSDGMFSITAPIISSITINSPNGGESWMEGTTHDVTWTSTGVTYLNLYYSTDNGLNWNFFADGVDATLGVYSWSIFAPASGNCLVKAEDMNNFSVFDVSNSTFTITAAPSVALVSPNGFESWNAGSVQTIYWTGNALSDNLSLAYSTDLGSTWTSIATGLANSSSYSWTIPNTVSDNCLVQIVDGNSTSVRDSSDAKFSIRAAGSTGITLSQPVGSETWLVGYSQDIMWSYNYAPATNVKVEYTTNNGSTWTVLTASTSVGTGGNGSYYWASVPNTPSTQCKVKVTDVANPAIRDVSENVFTILNPSVTVTSPNGGETWIIGSTHDITWTNVGDMFYAMIEYSTDNGASWIMENDGTPNTGTYSWLVPNTPSVNCLVRITDTYSGIQDVSDATFHISQTLNPTIALTAPMGGENWTVGSSHNITWTSSDITNVKIEYTIDGGAIWNSISSSYSAASGTFAWTIPNSPSTMCKVRVSDATNNAIASVNSTNFTISVANSLTVVSPNGGENWIGGSTHNVTWTSSGVTYLDLYYSLDNGLTWTFVNDGIPAALGGYSWTLPNVSSSNCRVKLVGGALMDMSDNRFTISAGSGITVVSPDGGEMWMSAHNYNVTWNSTGVNDVKIDYSIDDGASWTNIIPQYPAASGSYNWFIPAGVQTKFARIRVSNALDSLMSDISNARFNIEYRTIILITPNGGEVLTPGSPYNITWSYVGNIYYVKLSYSTNSGQTWNLITNTATNGSYSWNVPNTPSSNCLLSAYDNSFAIVGDTSNQIFTIAAAGPVLTTVNPNSATQGDTRTIWINANNAHFVQGMTQVYMNQGATSITGTSVNVQNSNYLSANFVFTTSHPAGLYDVNVFDPTDNTITKTGGFTLNQIIPLISVTSPNGGESWIAGAQRNVTWTSTGVSRVDINFSSDNGLTWQLIADSIASTGTFAWTLPNISSSTCKIKVTDANNPFLMDISNNVFSIIIPAITVTQPNGAEVWTGGTSQQIKWTSTGASSYVNIEYSTTNGMLWSSIATAAYNNGTYYWNIPNLSSTQCLVRVKDYYTPSIADVSDAVFTILPTPPSITLSSPNGGESWIYGTSQTIYWNSVNVNMAKLEYTLDNGATWTVITDSVAASTSSYNWTIPNVSSTQARIRISDSYNIGVTDMSNSVFSILSPSITLNNPNGGETWEGGTVQNILWTSNDVNYVSLMYSTNNGISWSYIANGILNNGSFSWTIPNTPSTQCLVKVYDYNYTSFTDQSDAVFAITQIPPAITVTSPNGGETWLYGSSQYIYWTSVSVNNVKISFSTNNGGSWTVVSASTPASNGYYSWAIPNVSSTQCKVKIEDVNSASVNDVSDNTFTIAVPVIAVTSPNGGETWIGGTSHAITWTSQNVSNYVVLEYTINNGSTWTTIYNGAYNSGTYNWTVPNNPSTQCKVRVKNYYNAAIFDMSDATFTIQMAPMTLTVNSPNGGENYAVGTTQNITWSSVSINNVKIQYSINNGMDWMQIVASTPASNGYYAWTIPNTESSQCLVKISNADSLSISDQSNALFSIVNPVITVTSPVGGEVWTGGEYHDITWTSNYSSNYVSIDYSVNNGSSWQAVTNYEYNDGSFSWLVPNNPSTQCLVRVRDSYTTTLADTSAAVFTILNTPPSVTVSYPNGNENLIVGSTCNISWTSVSVSNVIIEYSVNNGSSWSTVIASTPAVNASYAWTVPNTPSTLALVKISDAGNAVISDVSNSKFNIVVPTITVTAPNGAESWTAGTYHNITWTSSNISSYVSIDYSTDNGLSWLPVIGQKYNNGTYNWYVANTPSVQCLVRVKDYSNSAIEDVSNAVFTILPIPPSVTVNYPNGYENLLAGSTAEIRWSFLNVNDVKIEFTSDNGATWNTVVASTPASSGLYPWTVPTVTSTNCRIRISDVANSAITDMSNNLFNITTPFITVTSPNGGQQWGVGSTKTITWTSNGVQNVKLEYTFNNGSSWTLISASTLNTGTYNWTIPNTPSNNCRVRIRDVANPSVFDVSDNLFSIPFPSVALNTPNGGQQWAVGSTQYIYWNSTSVANVKIEYTTDGNTWNVISASSPASAGSYVWVVSNTPSATCKVKISNVSLASINDVSDANFAIIAPDITVTAPAGGESWMVGSTQAITWTSVGANSYVKLEYSTDNGISWLNIDNYEYNDGAFSWLIPNTPSANCKVRVIDYLNATVIGESVGTFTIVAGQPSITLNTPNGGQSWNIGTQHDITWTSLNITNIKIEYSFNNGSSWTTIAASAPAASGSYSWTIPNTPSNNCKVRVRDISNPSVFDVSDAVFAIPFPSIALTTPNGGENWGVGSIHNIYWTSTSVPNVKIESTIDGGTTWDVVSASIPNTGSYNWTVPNTPSATCKIKVSHATIANVKDISDNTFTITAPQVTLTAPNGGEIFTGLGSTNVTWTGTGLSNYVTLLYSTNDGSTWTTFAQSAPNTGSYYWSIPNIATTTALIKIKDYSNPTVFDESNATFTVVYTTPSITLTTPNGGENWLTGSSNYIYWSTIAIANIKIEYSVNDTSWTVISNSTPASAGSYYWNVPNTPSTTCKVRISDVLNSTVNDASNAYFSISQPIPSLAVTSPNGGEIWTVGDYNYITWNSNVVQNVKIEYSFNNGSSWVMVSPSTSAASGSYYWTVPNTPSVNCKVRIRDVANPSLFDVSNAVFRIAPVVVNNNVQLVDSIKPLNVCKGDTFKVYYHASGTYNSGNMFKLQLSDNVGSFTNPVEVGYSLTTDTLGYVSGVMPMTASNGTGYKVRVNSSNWSKVGIASDTTISVNSPVFDFYADQTLKYLPDGNVQCFYQGVDTAVSCKWEFSTGDTAVVKNPWYGFTQVGFYNVKLTTKNSAGCSITVAKQNFIDIEQIFPTIPLAPIDSNTLNAIVMVNTFNGFTVGNHGSIAVTHNGGVSWSLRNSGTTLDLTNLTALDTAHVFVTGTNGLIMNSVDGGLSWAVMQTGTNETFKAIALRNANEGWAVGTNGTLSRYNGTTWTADNINGVNIDLNGVHIDTTSGNVFVVGANGSVFVYNGTIWTAQTTPVTVALNDICFHGDQYGLAVGDNGTVIRTNDAGTTWNLAFSGIDAKFTRVQIADADTAWAVGKGGVVYQTVDGGLSFTRFSIGDTVDLSGFCYVRPYIGAKAQGSSSGGRGVVVGKDGAAYVFGPNMIAVDNIASHTICAGNQFKIPFFVTGTFNPGNIFTAQLSDAFGDFSSGTIIGTVISVAKDTILATIPLNNPAGTGFKIRVSSSDAAVDGIDSDFELTIASLPIVNLGNDTSACIGNAVSLNANNPSDMVLWSTGDSTQILSANTTGDYSATVTNSSGCKATDIIHVTMVAFPVVNLGADTALCPNATLTLDAQNSSATYNWSNGTNLQTLTVAVADTFIVTVTNATGCATTDSIKVGMNTLPVVTFNSLDSAYCNNHSAVTLAGAPVGGTYSGVGVTGSLFDPSVAGSGFHDILYTYTDVSTGCQNSDTATVHINASPIVSLGADTGLCPGSSLTLDAQNVGELYSWSTGSTLQTVTVTSANTYSVTVTNAIGCSSNDNIIVGMNVLPVVSIAGLNAQYCIYNSAVTLIGSPAGGTFSGAGITGDLFDPAIAGQGSHLILYNYTDNVTGCHNNAASMTNVDLCIDVEEVNFADHFRVYPNPVSANAFVEFAISKSENISIKLLDVLGNELYVANSEFMAAGNHTKTINTDKLASGTYIVVIKTDAGSFQKLIVK